MSDSVVESVERQKEEICSLLDQTIEAYKVRSSYETALGVILDIIGDGSSVSHEEIMTIKRVAEDA
jgi:hypothetical protein